MMQRRDEPWPTRYLTLLSSLPTTRQRRTAVSCTRPLHSQFFISLLDLALVTSLVTRW